MMKIERINFLKIEQIAQSKHELYKVMVDERGMYLPSENENCIEPISEISVEI
jgi:hypothetical protein